MRKYNSIRIITYFLAVIVFVVCGTLIVSYAAGYKIDFQNRKISQTGMIDVQADSQSEVFLNGESVGKGRTTLRSIEPGDYSIEVKKSQYISYLKTIELTAGEAEILNDIVLFKQNAKIEEFKTNLDGEALQKMADSENLVAQGGEIYANGQFVTRSSSDVSGLSWYPDQRYLAFTANGKLNMIEIDGTNHIELFDKTSNSTVVFVNSGRSVIFENNGKTYQAQIK